MSKLKVIFLGLVSIFIISLLVFYFLLSGNVDFISFGGSSNNNFTITNSSLQSMQFYSNMRYPTNDISYKISSTCNTQRQYDMKRAFDELANVTSLSFYPVTSNEDITIDCENTVKIEENFFVAGEGGPTNITQTSNFNVISHGSILLLRDSDCQDPNVPLHELLHALGFQHSENKNNIMYAYSKCSQTLGSDIPLLINELYSVPSEPDLSFDNATAQMDGRYLSVQFTVRNNGLAKSNPAQVVISEDGKQLKSFNVDAIDVGFGRQITFGNLFVSDLNVKEVQLEIKYEESEINKNNNIIKLKTSN